VSIVLHDIFTNLEITDRMWSITLKNVSMNNSNCEISFKRAPNFDKFSALNSCKSVLYSFTFNCKLG
jgi:hypothetical protein